MEMFKNIKVGNFKESSMFERHNIERRVFVRNDTCHTAVGCTSVRPSQVGTTFKDMHVWCKL